MTFIPCDKWKTIFFIKFYRYAEVFFNLHALAFFETLQMKEARILFIFRITVRY